jgi:pyruvate dehydrogenase E2 component (dihydrolipoamide acetyltransferase)
MRAAIARRVTYSKLNVPHFYATTDVEVDELLAFRQRRQVAVTVNDLLICAVARSLKAVPAMNVSWLDEQLRQFASVDIGFAVAVDGGVISPVIRGAHEKSLTEIASEARELTERARQRKIAPHEYAGATFTISNLGMYNLRAFTAIIDAPQAAILAVGRAQTQPVVRAGAVTIATMMNLTLSVDHRAVDGATAAQFLTALKAEIESPIRHDEPV